MRTWLGLVIGIAVGTAIFRVIAIGRRLPKTLTEQRAEAWGGMPKRYAQTQPANRWKLRMWRTPERRKSA